MYEAFTLAASPGMSPDDRREALRDLVMAAYGDDPDNLGRMLEPLSRRSF